MDCFLKVFPENYNLEKSKIYLLLLPILLNNLFILKLTFFGINLIKYLANFTFYVYTRHVFKVITVLKFRVCSAVVCIWSLRAVSVGKLQPSLRTNSTILKVVYKCLKCEIHVVIHFHNNKDVKELTFIVNSVKCTEKTS